MTLQEKLALACRVLAMQRHNDLIYGHVALSDTPGQYWMKANPLLQHSITPSLQCCALLSVQRQEREDLGCIEDLAD
jgi:hypothetical protein